MEKVTQQVEFGPFRDYLRAFLADRRYEAVFVLCDSNTRQHCVAIDLAIGDLYACQVIEIAAGESEKTLSTCEKVWSFLAANGADRNSLLINLGGGVVTDLGGFCAATFMRGMPFVHMPTSVLAMTDAAIGGKVGVDFHGYKNYIGSFAQAEKVIIDPFFINTLPDVQKRNGLAEVIKHACLVSGGELNTLLGFDDLSAVGWTDLTERSARIKMEFVDQDQFDRGIRGALNFGHTIGHAIESYSLGTTTPLHHGEAVALGMLVESRISMQFCGLTSEGLSLIERCIGKYFEDVKFPKIDLTTLWQFMRKDKKKAGDDVLFSLLSAIGEPKVAQVVPESIVNEAYLHFAEM